MDRSFFIVVNGEWLLDGPSHAKRLSTQALCPLADTLGHLRDGCLLLVKFRDPGGGLSVDPSAHLTTLGDAFHIKSEPLAAALLRDPLRGALVAFFFEGTDSEARCIVDVWSHEFLADVERADPTLRLEAFDLPPRRSTTVDAEGLIRALYRAAGTRDAELFAVHASRFLDSPHIITALFSHLFSIRSDDNLRFPIQVKKIAEQLRILLDDPKSAVRIGHVRKSHLDLWAEAQGLRFAFLDGGQARIPALPGLEPMALRVGIYSVRPGVPQGGDRERWSMTPFVLGDLIDRARRVSERPDARRFTEAARYVLEPLVGLEHLRSAPDTRVLLVHGPLINQFVQYDEGPPHFIPFIAPTFLQRYGIDEPSVARVVADVPSDTSGQPMWNQFMAIYAYVMHAIHASTTPIVGVVERATGRAVTSAVLARLKLDRVVTAAYVERLDRELEQYEITDDFLFGCVLRAGEYLTPVPIQKNPPRRAQDRWAPVVRRYPQPTALLLKTEEANFPFRVEMNAAAAAEHSFLVRFLFHTARLLPRYAFPVGLDIVDKYAKVPDWISRGVSTELSATMLRRAMRTGDANIVMQMRLLLAKGPRDFFYRPDARGL